MHRKIFILSLLLFITYGATLSGQATLEIKVNGIEARGKGTMVLLLFNSAEGFDRKEEGALRRVSVTDFDATLQYTFKDLSPGQYSVMVFQDLNENDEMDKNFIGFPKEPLGATNLKRMGRPSFKKTAVSLSAQTVRTEIKLMNQ